MEKLDEKEITAMKENERRKPLDEDAYTKLCYKILLHLKEARSYAADLANAPEDLAGPEPDDLYCDEREEILEDLGEAASIVSNAIEKAIKSVDNAVEIIDCIE